MPRSRHVLVVGPRGPCTRARRSLDTEPFTLASADSVEEADGDAVDCVVAADGNPQTIRAASDASTPTIAVVAEDATDAAFAAGATDVVVRDAPAFDSLLVRRVRNATARAATERRVADERARFTALFGQFPEPTVAYEFADGRPIATAANDAFRETFGDADTDIRGRDIDDLIVGPEREVEAAVLNRRVDHGDTIDREVTRRTADGDRVFWLRNISLDTDPPTGFAVYTDVTDRLRERERARTYLDHSRDVVMTLDDDRTCTYASPAAVRTFGYHPSDLVGERAISRVHPDDRDRISAALDAVTGDDSETIEFRVLDADGDTRWVEAVLTDQRDNPLIDGYLLNVRDVTERRARDDDRRRQARIIATLHDVAVDIETATTPGDVYQSLVDAAETVLDYQLCIVDERDGDRLVPAAVPTDTPDDYYFDAVPLDREDNLAARVARERETVVVDDLAAEGVTPAAESYRSAITVPLGDYGVFQAVADEPNGFDEADREFTEILASHAVATLDRLTRERELEHQTERLEKFASIVSHDLRTPLQVAVGAIELARETDDLDRLDTATDALDRIDRLAGDILAWARGATLVEDTEPVDVAALARDCWRDLDTADATLRVERVVVDADPNRLRQLLANLLRNSVEHGSTDSPSRTQENAIEHGSTDSHPQAQGDTREDTASVTVTVAPTKDDTGFYVEDDGRGVPEDIRDDVFDAGYTTSATGSGFGLDIARDVATAHGWTLTLTESDDGGARFVIDCTDTRTT